MTEPTPNVRTTLGKTGGLALLVIVLLLFTVGLNRRHLWGADEPREAGLAAAMSMSGNCATPRLNGTAFLEKPPLYYWIQSSLFRIFGTSTSVSRLTSALAAIGGVWCVILLAGGMKFTRWSIFLSGFVLATLYGYWDNGRQCLLDMTLCFFITAAMICFWEISRPAGWRALPIVCFPLFLSGAILTKGPVGLAIPCSALIVWLIIKRDFNWLRWGSLFAGIGLSLIAFVAWNYFVSKEMGESLVFKSLWFNTLGRFSGSSGQHVEPFYYYLEKSLPNFIPWVLFLPLALRYHIPQIHKDKNSPSLFLILWFAVPFLLLCISAGKRTLYLLPLYPPVAMMLGQAIGMELSENGRLSAWFTKAGEILCGMLIVVPVVFAVVTITHKQPFSLILAVLCPGLALGLWALRYIAQRNWRLFTVTLAPTMVVLFLTLDVGVHPVFNEKESFEPLFQYCRQLDDSGVQVGLYYPSERFSGAAVFYLHKTIPQMRDASDLTAFLGSGEKTAAVLTRHRLPDAADVAVLRDFCIGRREIIVVVSKHTVEVASL